MPEAQADLRVSPQKLSRLGLAALTAAGVDPDQAQMAIAVLLRSDMRGIESHGFARFAEYYVARSQNAEINLRPDIRVLRETAAAASLEGDHALGFVPATIAMRLAMDKARATGVGMVSVRNSTHYGPASPYALMAIEEGMIGISMTTGGLYVTPPGGAARTYGLNAMSFAAPSRPPEAPFCLDMATSVVALGKFEIKNRRGQAVPPGWGVAPDGSTVSSLDELRDSMGSILPLGGDAEHGAWKGFGLAVMVDVLTGMLSRGGTSATIGRRDANHFFAALRVDAFVDVDEFYDQMSEMRQTMRAQARLPGAEPLTLPGEPEAAIEEECRRLGIPCQPSVLEGLKAMCHQVGVDYDLEQ